MTFLFKKNTDDIAYKIIGQPPKSPKVGKLRADKLAITIDLLHEEQEHLKAVFKDQFNDGFWMKTKNPHFYKYSYKIQLNEYDFGIHGEKSLLIQFGPKSANYNFMRVEFNPDKAKPGIVKAILDKLLLNGYHRIIHEGKVTRFDETVEIHFCEIDDLLFYYPNIKASTTYKTSGKVETEYLGSKKGEKQLCIYDKTKEVKEKNAGCPNNGYSSKAEIPQYPITRIELRTTPKSKNFTLKDIAKLDNPFQPLVILHYFNLTALNIFKDDKERSAFKCFLDSCRYRGLQQAYKQISDPSMRKKFRKLVATGTVKWWDSDSIGIQRGPLIKKIMNPKPVQMKFYFPNFAIKCITINDGI